MKEYISLHKVIGKWGHKCAAVNIEQLHTDRKVSNKIVMILSSSENKFTQIKLSQSIQSTKHPQYI